MHLGVPAEGVEGWCVGSWDPCNGRALLKHAVVIHALECAFAVVLARVDVQHLPAHVDVKPFVVSFVFLAVTIGVRRRCRCPGERRRGVSPLADLPNREVQAVVGAAGAWQRVRSFQMV
jgi:hypothetical protein